MAFGFWAYLISLIISIVLGLFNLDLTISIIILAALGVFVGFMNLSWDTEHLFSIFSLTFFFWIAHYLTSNVLGGIGSLLASVSFVFLNMLIFSLFVLLVLSFKNLYSSSFRNQQKPAAKPRRIA